MFRRRTSDLHRSAIRLSLFDAILLAPVIALPLLFVVSLALFSMVALLVVTGAAASLLLLSLFFHPWLVIGVAIDVVLLYLVLVTGWDPFAAGAAHRSMA